MTMADSVKLALRVSTNAYDAEINALIGAAYSDMTLSGIDVYAVSGDPLILRAVTLYCKANFGSDPDSDRYAQSYNMLKNALVLSGDYKIAEADDE